MQGISMVYTKLLKDQIKLHQVLSNKGKKYPSIFFVLKTSQVLICMSLFTFFLICNTLYLHKHLSPSSREYCADIT